jgi:hypothetical protein
VPVPAAAGDRSQPGVGAVGVDRQDQPLAVVAKAPAERFTAHAHARGWRHARLLSLRNTTFNADYRAEGTDEEQFPVAHVFVRRDGRIYHFWSSELMVPPEPGQYPRHVDFMAAVGHPRPHAGRPRRRLDAQPRVTLDTRLSASPGLLYGHAPTVLAGFVAVWTPR